MAEKIILVSTVKPGEVKEVRQIWKALDLVQKGKWTVDLPVVRQQPTQAEGKGK